MVIYLEKTFSELLNNNSQLVLNVVLDNGAMTYQSQRNIMYVTVQQECNFDVLPPVFLVGIEAITGATASAAMIGNEVGVEFICVVASESLPHN